MAESVYDAINGSESNYYFFLGKPLEWDGSPDTPIDTQPYINDVRQNLVILKKIQPSDCKFMVPSRYWSDGAIYDYYDDSYGKTVTYPISSRTGAILYGNFDLTEFGQGWLVEDTNISPTPHVIFGATVVSADATSITLSNVPTGDPTEIKITCVTASSYPSLENADFYVINNSNQVYKCLDNNGGGNSTVEPTTTSGEPVTSLDGYRWKYLFTVPTSVMEDFGSSTEIPIGEAGWASSLGIFKAVVMHSGTGYTTATATITGDGSAATAEVVIVDGGVSEVNMTDFGVGYNWATITITGDGTGAAVRAVLAPSGGHGASPQRELFSKALRLSTTFVYEDDTNQGFVVDNEYRQTGIIKDPLIFGEPTKYTGASASPCFVVTGDFAYADVADDDILTDSNGKRYVVVAKPVSDPDPDPVSLLVQSIDNATPTVDLVVMYGLTNATLSEVTPPDIDKYTGAILYVDNRGGYQVTAEEAVSLKSTLRF